MKRQKITTLFGAVVLCIAMITATAGVIAERTDMKIQSEDTITPSIGSLSRGVEFIWDWSAEAGSGDNGCLGVEFDGTNFWVTGANGLNGTNMLYKFDADGNYITGYEQGTSTDWGWRDLAFDGTYLYGSDEDELVKIDPATGGVIELMTKPAGFETSPCRALAYDPDTDHFYCANWASNIVEFDRTGAIINSYANLLSLYGLAWDDVTEGGPYLWGHSQDPADEDATLVTQINPTTGSPTGVSYAGFMNVGAANNLAGGACFINDWEGEPLFVGLTQSTPDTVWGAASVASPELEITEIKGGIGAKATIKNVGDGDATDIAWNITIEGGLVLIGGESTGTVASLAADASVEISTGLVLGFGRPTITVAAESAEGAIVDGSASGILLLILLLGVS
jgi:hypothetical protein